MKVLVSIFIFCVAAQATTISHLTNKIVGGEPVNIEDYPYQVSLYHYGAHMCGGSILNKNTIVTAAHCVYKADHINFQVHVGNNAHSDGIVHNVSEIIVHPNFFYPNEDYDVAVLKLSTPLQFSKTVQPIELQTEEVEAGTTAWVSGWGVTIGGTQTASSILYATDINVMSDELCRHIHFFRITDRMFCAQTKGHDSCQGDSGGPLVANGKLIGIVSWGYQCADPTYPGVYSKVSELYSWILENK